MHDLSFVAIVVGDIIEDTDTLLELVSKDSDEKIKQKEILSDMRLRMVDLLDYIAGRKKRVSKTRTKTSK